MTQTDKEETTVDENTDTFSSTLEFDGNYPLTSTGDKLEGLITKNKRTLSIYQWIETMPMEVACIYILNTLKT